MLPIQIIGHRGAAGHATENTLASLEKGCALGCDWLELDVRACATGELLVFHDDTLFRLAGDPRPLAELTLAEAQSVTLEGGHAIPTLAEVLARFAGRARLCIELKEEGLVPALSQLLAPLLQNGAWRWDDLLIISFLHPELLRLRESMPQSRIAPIIAGLPEDYAAFAEHLRADAVHPCIHFINREFVADAHRRGIPVRVWTCNEPAHIDRAIELGVDAIASDYPDRVRERLHADRS